MPSGHGHAYLARDGGTSDVTLAGKKRMADFFFQAEDGIRDLTVTGVQTCALPICVSREQRSSARAIATREVLSFSAMSIIFIGESTVRDRGAARRPPRSGDRPRA